MPAQNDDDETSSSSTPPVTIPLPIPPNPETFTYQPSTSFPPLSAFDSQFIHPALIIPAKRTAELRRTLTHILMHHPKKKDVYPVTADEGDPATERKLALKIPEEGTDVYEDPILAPLLLQSSPSSPAALRRSTHTRHQSYSDLTVEQTLRLILPPPHLLRTPIPTSFEIAGHIAHLNLPPPLLPYRRIIGKVILDKNRPRIKTVVNKLGTIANEYRTFEMESLADDGEERWEVEVKEEGCRFRLNFREVYWNSRLQFEHKRLVTLIAGTKRQRTTTTTKKKRGNEDDDDDIISSSSSATLPSSPHPQHLVVVDVMAGVGPFAIPLASHYSHVTVHANDLNPRSFHYLNVNAKLNRCNDNKKLYTYNMDGRLFVRRLERRNVVYHAVIMNLPAIAVEFLDVFRGWRNPSSSDDDDDDRRRRPVIYVYCFTPKDDDEGRDAVERCETALGCPLEMGTDEVSVHTVRDVSPNKNMVCVSFRLPKAVEGLERIKVKGDENEEENEEKEEEKGKEEMVVCEGDGGCEEMGDGQLQKKARKE